MSGPYLPEPPPADSRRRPWWCPHGDAILQNMRPTDEGWEGFCSEHGRQLGVQFDDSQVPENDDDEEEL